MFVLDTDVLSITSPLSVVPHPMAEAWRDWVRGNVVDLHFSVVTLTELRFGVERLRAKGASRKAADLTRWLLASETVHRTRILDVTPDIAHRAGELLWHAVGSGTQPSTEDALIAATADICGFRLLSRNGKHMGVFGIDWANPLENFPGDRES